MKLLISISALFLASCAGYTLGGKKPSHLSSVTSIYVPLAKNNTLFPRAEAFTTSSAVDAFLEDGTYRITTPAEADATLYLTLRHIHYRQVRASEFDSLRSEELEMEVTLDWVLADPLKPGLPLEKGSARSRSRFFVDDNLQTARRNALPDTLTRASRNIVSRLADGL